MPNERGKEERMTEQGKRENRRQRECERGSIYAREIVCWRESVERKEERECERGADGVRENDISDLSPCFFPDYNLSKIIKFIRLNLFQVGSNFLFFDEEHQLLCESKVYSAKKMPESQN